MISDCIEKEISFKSKTTYVKIDKITRIRHVTSKIQGGEVEIIIRNTEGTLRVTVPHNQRKVDLSQLITKVVETGELKKNTTKAGAFRKTICDLLRYLIIKEYLYLYNHIIRQ